MRRVHFDDNGEPSLVKEEENLHKESSGLQFTSDDVRNILYLINKSDIKGSESEIVSELKRKISLLANNPVVSNSNKETE